MAVLYLVRHAAAEDARAGQSDADRALTAEGIRKFRRAAEGIARLLAERPPPVLLTSPFLRAHQTATILADAFDRLKVKVDVRLTQALAPPGRLPELLRETGRGDTLAVAHDPFLSEWIGMLCCGRAGQVQMKKGALAALDLAANSASAELLYLVQPAMLRRL
jgi:phosphohistidine phosphatase